MAEITRATAADKQTVDNTTLSAEDIANGNLNVTVGVVAVRPAEFVPVEIQEIFADATTASTSSPGKPPFLARKKRP